MAIATTSLGIVAHAATEHKGSLAYPALNSFGDQEEDYLNATFSRSQVGATYTSAALQTAVNVVAPQEYAA